jgi:hypothetical protein
MKGQQVSDMWRIVQRAGPCHDFEERLFRRLGEVDDIGLVQRLFIRQPLWYLPLVSLLAGLWSL